MERTIEPIGPIPMLRQRVFETLEQLIIDGTLAPGQHLVETELAARLGVSRGPVREALHSLNRDGWVELRPRQGAFVRQPTDEEVDDFFQVRSLLEGECARLAALKAGADAHARLRDLLVTGWAAVDTGEERTLVEANTALHGAIVDLAENATLQELTHLLRKRSQWFFSPVSVKRAQTAWKEHEGVVDAIVAGDGTLAADRLRAHIEGTRRVYKTVVSTTH